MDSDTRPQTSKPESAELKADEADSKPGAPVFNRTVGLKDKYRPLR